MNIIKYQYQFGHHKGNEIIWIKFPYDKVLQRNLQQKFKTVKWSVSNNAWYVRDKPVYRTFFNLEQKPPAAKAIEFMCADNKIEFKKYQETLQLMAYSQNTFRTYCLEFSQLLQVLKNVPVALLKPEKLRAYMLYCTNTLKLSENTLHSRLNAIKFYFEKVLHQASFFVDIPRPKKPQKLPKALTVNDIKKLIQVVTNTKHQLILKLCYGMGLRVSEIVKIKITDVDSNAMQVLIEQGKGKKDRYVNLPNSILDDLRLYYKMYLPKVFLFEGEQGGMYSIRSVQMVFKTAMNKAKINKVIGVHGLRHSYATHLLDQGTDISLIQKLLGHNDIKTTLIYTEISDKNIAKVKSPLDSI